MTDLTAEPLTEHSALVAAFHAMDAACRWAAGETAGIKTTQDADWHIAGYDALLDATVKAGQAAGVLTGGVVAAREGQGLDVERLRIALDLCGIGVIDGNLAPSQFADALAAEYAALAQQTGKAYVGQPIAAAERNEA